MSAWAQNNASFFNRIIWFFLSYNRWIVKDVDQWNHRPRCGWGWLSSISSILNTSWFLNHNLAGIHDFNISTSSRISFVASTVVTTLNNTIFLFARPKSKLSFNSRYKADFRSRRRLEEMNGQIKQARLFSLSHLPKKFKHFAFSLHLWFPTEHSSISAQKELSLSRLFMILH